MNTDGSEYFVQLKNWLDYRRRRAADMRRKKLCWKRRWAEDKESAAYKYVTVRLQTQDESGKWVSCRPDAVRVEKEKHLNGTSVRIGLSVPMWKWKQMQQSASWRITTEKVCPLDPMEGDDSTSVGCDYGKRRLDCLPRISGCEKRMAVGD